MAQSWSVVREWNVLALERLGQSGVARIALNRPEKRNALSHELIAAFMEALEAIRADQSIRLVVTQKGGTNSGYVRPGKSE